MQRDAIAAMLRQVGLARVTDALLTLAAPTIWLHATATAEGAIPVGSSKLGGRPDLPPGEDWPAWHEPMAFLGQFNLAETAPYDVDGVLPRSGLLSFFYETNGEPLYAERWGLPEPVRPETSPDFPDPRSWRVRYFPADPATFFRRVTPAAVNPDGRFPNCALRCTTEWTIPEADSPDVQPLGLTASERLALIGIDGHINGGTWEEPGIRLLGQPYNLHGPTLLQCDLAARGVQHVQWDLVTVEQERDAARRWQLLLQLYGGREVPYNWGGGGVLHFCIERAALAARDFQRTWVNMQLV